MKLLAYCILEKYKNTPLPIIVIGLIAGAAVIGAATAVTSVSLQGYQQSQLNKQLAEQEEIVDLQKKLTQHQLKQFETQEKVEEDNKESNMFRSPTSISGLRTGMTTRSMTQTANIQRNMVNTNQLNNIGLGPIRRGNIVGSGVPVVRRSPIVDANLNSSMSSNESFNLFDRSSMGPPHSTPRTASTSFMQSSVPSAASRRSSQNSSLNSLNAQSTESLNVQHQSFARGLQVRFPQQLGADENGFELRHRGNPPPLLQSTAQKHYKFASSTALHSTPKNTKLRVSPSTSGPQTEPALPDIQFAPHSTLRSIKTIPRRIRSLFPTSGKANLNREGGGRIHRVNNSKNNNRLHRASVGKILNTHKRKLIIGGGVISGAGNTGGIVAGSLSSKSEKDMQNNNNESSGVFQQLSSGSLNTNVGSSLVAVAVVVVVEVVEAFLALIKFKQQPDDSSMITVAMVDSFRKRKSLGRRSSKQKIKIPKRIRRLLRRLLIKRASRMVESQSVN